MPLPQLSLAVVGVDFPNKRGPTRRFELAICHRGEPVELRPEPKNKADRNAVAVYSCRGVQLGYISAERAPRISQIIRQGVDTRAVFQETGRWGAVVRVAFDGDVPLLPEPRKPADPEPDWYPDDMWED